MAVSAFSPPGKVEARFARFAGGEARIDAVFGGVEFVGEAHVGWPPLKELE